MAIAYIPSKVSAYRTQGKSGAFSTMQTNSPPSDVMEKGYDRGIRGANQDAEDKKDGVPFQDSPMHSIWWKLMFVVG